MILMLYDANKCLYFLYFINNILFFLKKQVLKIIHILCYKMSILKKIEFIFNLYTNYIIII